MTQTTVRCTQNITIAEGVMVGQRVQCLHTASYMTEATLATEG